MKTLPSSMKSSTSSRKEQTRSSAKGHLFLGHKVLGELRILMRLASINSQAFPRVNGWDPSSF